MDTAPRVPAKNLIRSAVPMQPGVYAWYRDQRRVYIGKATRLCDRLCGNHRGNTITSSALQRNVAEFLKIASSADIKARRYKPSLADVEQVRAWLADCEVAWIVSTSRSSAEDEEKRLKAEFLPLLTKR